jgi:hypothetical protein
MPIQCLASSEILTPHPLTARRVCSPPPLVRGEDTLAGWRGGGGSKVRKTPNTALYSIYVSNLWCNPVTIAVAFFYNPRGFWPRCAPDALQALVFLGSLINKKKHCFNSLLKNCMFTTKSGVGTISFRFHSFFAPSFWVRLISIRCQTSINTTFRIAAKTSAAPLYLP